MLGSKASPVTSPTSKAPGTSHQAQRSFLKEADEASPSPRAYLLPALCSPTSTPCLFLADLRQANTFHWNNTNAVKNLVPQKEQTKLQEKLLEELLPSSKFHWGVRETSRLPCSHRQRCLPLGSRAGSWECSVYVRGCRP